MTTNPPTSQPDEAEEAPDGEHSADVIRAIADGLRKRDTRTPSPDSVAEKARRAAEAIDEMLTSGGDWSPGAEWLADIITAEFQK